MRWPAGEGWLRPSSLSLLDSTPIDTLILPQAAAGSNSKPFFDEAHRRGVALVAFTGDASDPAAARAAGFDAVASTKPSDGAIPWMPRGEMPRNSASPVLAVTESVWPSVRASNTERWAGGAGAASADAGPTGVPWVDTNGWFVQMARVLAPGKGIWIVVDPPEKMTTLRAETYVLAVADAAAYGGRWVVTLDDAFASGLAAGDSSALADWKAVAGALKFFAARQQWAAYPPIGVVGIVSDFRGDNEFLSTEILNLISRRHVPFRVIESAALRAGALDDLKAVIYADQQLPAEPLRKQLVAFAQAGGLLVCPKASASLASGPGVPGSHGRFQVHKAGNGRIAVSTEDSMDPYVCSGDVHMLLGRRQDLIRVWNPGAANSYYTAPAGGRGALLQMLSYTRHQVSDMSVYFAHPWRGGRFYTIDSPQARSVEAVKRLDGVEMHIPPFTVFFAMELEG
ncbi:MAG: hypothetical protein ACE141_13080 [Bryobacteraceae bacterium]